jgi:hypothetical protein
MGALPGAAVRRGAKFMKFTVIRARARPTGQVDEVDRVEGVF